MTATDAPLGENMRAKFQELETRRRLHIDGLDLTIEAMNELRALDRHLVAIGLHSELQLEHLAAEDLPLDQLPEFQEQPSIQGGLIEGGHLVVGGPEGSEIIVPLDQAGRATTTLPATTPPPDSSEADVPAASRRRFTEEQKAEAVRLADELGSDTNAAAQSGCSAPSIRNWREAGFGKKRKSVNETAAPRAEKVTDAHDGPQVKCPICKTKCPIEGEPGIDSRAAALRVHYKTSPDCQTALRLRHA